MTSVSSRCWPRGVVAVASLWLACRVGPVDAVRAPFPDAAADGANGSDGADGADGAGGACDLLAQNCANQRTCYPVDGKPGQTSCELTGSAPPSAFCVMSLECDAREACVFIAESDTTLCATICDLSAAQTGCLPRATCRLIPGYSAGFCVP